MTGSPDPHPLLRGIDPLPTGPDGLVCSAKDCRAVAAFDLQWNNPKIHTPDRRKHWLACAEHRESLTVVPVDPRFPARGRGPARRVGLATQPPMADMGRSGCRNDGSSMPWPGRLVATARTHWSAISASVAPERSGARRSDSVRANRQFRS